MFALTTAEIDQTPWVDEFYADGIDVRTTRTTLRFSHVIACTGRPGAERAAQRQNHNRRRATCEVAYRIEHVRAEMAILARHASNRGA